MAFNGSGTFNRLHNWQEDADNNIDIEPDRHDEEDDGFATGLSNCITKDGQSTITANIPFNGKKITGYGSSSTPSARTDVPNIGQVQDGAFMVGASVSGTNTITFSVSPTITAYTEGQIFSFVAAGTNTGATTVNINSVGAKAVQKLGAALVAGDITANDVVLIRYDGTQFQMLSPARTLMLAEMRLMEDSSNGTNYVGFRAPSSLSADKVWKLPSEDGSENQFLKTDGNGNLSFDTPSSAITLLQTQTANGSASITFTSTYIASAKKYLIELINLVPSNNNVSFTLVVSTDNGSNYKTGASDYTQSGYRITSGGSLAGVAVSAAASIAITNTNTVSNSAGTSLSGEISFYDPASAVHKEFFISASFDTDGAGNVQYNNTQATYIGSTTAINNIKIDVSAGTFSGVLNLCEVS